MFNNWTLRVSFCIYFGLRQTYAVMIFRIWYWLMKCGDFWWCWTMPLCGAATLSMDILGSLRVKNGLFMERGFVLFRGAALFWGLKLLHSGDCGLALVSANWTCLLSCEDRLPSLHSSVWGWFRWVHLNWHIAWNCGHAQFTWFLTLNYCYGAVLENKIKPVKFHFSVKDTDSLFLCTG